MLGLSGPVRLRGLLVVLAVAIPLVLTGCDSDNGPTAAQAGQTLKNHILQLLKESDAQHLIITDPGDKNVACAGGQVKRTFAATGTDGDRHTSSKNIRAGLLGALDRVASYEVVNAGPLAYPVHVENGATRTKLVLDSPAAGVYAVSGETECLDS